jgi:DNA-binding GntR family transcriptional regulator
MHVASLSHAWRPASGSQEGKGTFARPRRDRYRYDMGTRIRHQQSAKDRAYAFVKERVLDGGYAGGDMLSEGEVSAAVGVSRTPVREAFLLLEAEGLMRLYPKRGALVLPVSAEEVRDVLETRLLIESHTAERVAREGPDLGAELSALLERQERLLARGDHLGFADADRRFHGAIVAAAGNAILTGLYDSLRDRQRRMSATTVARAPDVARRFLEEHRGIADALGRRDPEAAVARVEAHLRGAAEIGAA